MRVIQSCGSTSWGDPEIQTLKTALGMKTKHFDVILLCAKGSVLESEGIQHHLVVRSYFGAECKVFRSIKKVQSLLKYFPVDVIHTHFFRDLQILVPAIQMAKSKARLFLTIRMGGGIKKSDLLHRYLCSRLDRIFTISSDIQQHVIKACPVPEKKVDVLYDGIDLDQLNCHDNHKGEIRQELGLSPDSIVIGMVAQFGLGNGYTEFLQAARIITENTQRHVQFLVICSSNPEEKNHYNQMVGLSKTTLPDRDILFTEFCSNASRKMKAIDILFFPSRSKLLEIILLEAMAMGIPVVASSAESVSEVVLDQETGLLVPPRQADALANALMQYIQNPTLRECHAKAAKQQIQSRFNFRNYLEALIASYTS